MAKKTTIPKKAAKPAKPAKVVKRVKPPAKPKSPPAVRQGSDTGSAAAQIKFFSERIEELVKHLRAHHKDFDSKRGLLMLIGKRRRMLNYLARSNPKSYEKIASELKLARAKQ